MSNMSKERELSAALTAVDILEEAGERRDYTQSVLSGLDGKCIEPDAFYADRMRDFPNNTSIRSTLDVLHYNLPQSTNSLHQAQPGIL